jgi:hypothetical protein
MSIGRLNAANEGTKMIEKMKIFDKIDNIAHEEIQESEEE